MNRRPDGMVRTGWKTAQYCYTQPIDRHLETFVALRQLWIPDNDRRRVLHSVRESLDLFRPGSNP